MVQEHPWGHPPELDLTSVAVRRHQRMNLMAEHSSSMGQQTESFDHQKSEEVDTTELVGRCLYP